MGVLAHGIPEKDDRMNSALGDARCNLGIAAEWTAILLYTWTLVGPLLLPDRDFTDVHNVFGGSALREENNV